MTAAKMVLFDWQRGKIPFFVPPPQQVDDKSEEPNVTGDDKKGETETEEDKEKSSSAMKAIADVLSSQQLEDVPVQTDLFSDNELKGEVSQQTANAE